jgi:tryptophan synthase alpha chain
MKNKLDLVLKQIGQSKSKALIAYLAAGYPKFPEQTMLIKRMKAAGIDVLELGIPFSDPIADGPTIQFASQQALRNGATLAKILKWTKQLTKSIDLPIVYMSYLNPIARYGLERFAKDAVAAGVQGVIVPDLIPEEGQEIKKIFEAAGLHVIYLVAPTTPPERQRFIANETEGFLYAVSVRGVTGARSKLPIETKNWLARLRKTSAKPVCVGFGISGPAQIKALKSASDGFIVGSALIDVIRNSSTATRANNISRFVQQLKKECENGHHG